MRSADPRGLYTVALGIERAESLANDDAVARAVAATGVLADGQGHRPHAEPLTAG